MRKLTETYLTVHKQHTGIDVSGGIGGNFTLPIQTIYSVGKLYNMTEQDYVNCVYYCYEQNPLVLSDVSEYGKVQNYIKAIAVYAKNRSIYRREQNTKTQDSKWTTL